MTVLTRKRNADPIRLEDDPGYARAAGKLADLKARAGLLERRRGQLVEGLNREVTYDLLTKRAEALLTDDVVPLPIEVERAALRRDLGAIEDELGVVRRAVELQQSVVEEEHRRGSQVICDRLRPEHRAIIQRIAAALTELVAGLAAERDFRERLNDAGVLYGHDLRPMPLPGLGLFNDPNDPDSAAARWIREAREYGFTD